MHPDRYQFEIDDSSHLETFLDLAQSGEEIEKSSVVLVAGNPFVKEMQVGGEHLIENRQSSAVDAALGLYDYLLIKLVSKLLDLDLVDSDLGRLVRRPQWAYFVRGDKGRPSQLPTGLEASSAFLDDFQSALRIAKDRIKVVSQLDHNSGSSVFKFISPSFEQRLLAQWGESRNQLKAHVEAGDLTLDGFDLTNLPKTVRDGIYGTRARTLAHSKDIGIVPEALIRAHMNRLAREADWGEEVNRSLSGAPYCMTRNIYNTDPEGDLEVACPGVVAGVAGLISRDVVSGSDGGMARVLFVMEPDAQRVNSGEINGGLWFYDERIRPGTAPNVDCRFVMTPPRNPDSFAFSRFEPDVSCK